MSALITLFSIVVKVLPSTLKQAKGRKSIQIRKKEVKFSLFADDMIIYIGNSKKFIKLLSEFSKVTGQKINIQKSVVFAYTSNEHKTPKSKMGYDYNDQKKEKKCFDVHLTKHIQSLYADNHKMMMKEDLGKWGDILCHGLEDNIQRCPD